jgi:glycosyltransferase involved in cell wall biosynthesis
VDILWQRRLLEEASFIHITSALEGELISDIAPSTPRALVPNGVHWGRFRHLPDGQQFRQQWLGHRSGPVVLSLGRIAEKKGLDILVAAFARVVTAHPGAILVLAGPDDEGLTPALLRQARSAGIGDRVVFPGMLVGGDKLAALAAADLWALPSHTENFGVAAVEALAAGRATILSSSINIAPEAAKEGATFLVTPDVDSVFQALDKLMADSERRRELGLRAREFAKRYDWGVVGPLLVEMYRAAAG